MLQEFLNVKYKELAYAKLHNLVILQTIIKESINKTLANKQKYKKQLTLF